MSIKKEKVVDFIADEKDSNNVTLFIMDHLAWNKKSNDHLLMLQNKINCYLSFIESGELLKKRPLSKDRDIIIEVRGKYPLSKEAKEFYKKASEIIRKAGFTLKFNHSAD